MADKPVRADATPPDGQLLIYRDGATRLQVRLDGHSVWLSQRLIADLYQVSVKTVNEHLVNIFAKGELAREATIRSFRIVQTEGRREVSRTIEHYHLDAILAVGYRVRSARGTAFRQSATARLSELLVKGFTIVQNKLHFAIHGHTAAEIVKGRADAARPNMGLTTWKNAPGGPIRKADVGIAKNYLTQAEITELNRVVTMYLDFAEDQARRKKPMHMADWVERLDAFLKFNERDILTHAGGVSHELAERHAHAQFERHEVERLRLEAAQPTSDFDQTVEEVKRLDADTAVASRGVNRPRAKKAAPKRKPKGGGDV